MIRRTLRYLLLAGLLLPIAPATAADYAAAPTYVSAQTLPPELLPVPPAEDSAAAHDQIAQVLAAQQRNIGEAELARIRNEQRMRLELMTTLLGPRFNAAELPETFAFLTHTLTDAALITEADKKFWHTRRPYLVDPKVKLLVDRIDQSPAYPSGHTAQSRVLAEVMGLLMPEKREELRARAEDIALHRIDAGVHFPVDIEGGRLLAMLITGALMRSDTFHRDLDAAAAEIARVRP